MMTNQLQLQGFMLVKSVLMVDECKRIAERFALPAAQRAGSRCLLQHPWCAALAKQIKAQALVAGLLPPGSVAVQCTYFEKSAKRNWVVPTHQDISIPVTERVTHPDLEGWSNKEGQLFVHAPEEVLENLLAVRVHLDVCGTDDGPVRVFSGSHRLGRIDAEAATGQRAHFREVICTAEVGDALLMRPLILHTSSRASGTSRRRVLHFLFGPCDLPAGLRWATAV